MIDHSTGSGRLLVLRLREGRADLVTRATEDLSTARRARIMIGRRGDCPSGCNDDTSGCSTSPTRPWSFKRWEITTIKTSASSSRWLIESDHQRVQLVVIYWLLPRASASGMWKLSSACSSMASTSVLHGWLAVLAVNRGVPFVVPIPSHLSSRDVAALARTSSVSGSRHPDRQGRQREPLRTPLMEGPQPMSLLKRISGRDAAEGEAVHAVPAVPEAPSHAEGGVAPPAPSVGQHLRRRRRPPPVSLPVLGRHAGARVLPGGEVPRPEPAHQRAGSEARPRQPGRGPARDRGAVRQDRRRGGPGPRPAPSARACSSRSPTRSWASGRSSRCCATRPSPRSWSTGRRQIYVERKGRLELTNVHVRERRARRRDHRAHRRAARPPRRRGRRWSTPACRTARA